MYSKITAFLGAVSVIILGISLIPFAILYSLFSGIAMAAEWLEGKINEWKFVFHTKK